MRGLDWTGQGNRKWKERGDGVGRGGEPENNDNNNATIHTVRVTSRVNSDWTGTTHGINLMIRKMQSCCVSACVWRATPTLYCTQQGTLDTGWRQAPPSHEAPAAPMPCHVRSRSCVPQCPSLTKLNFGKSLADWIEPNDHTQACLCCHCGFFWGCAEKREQLATCMEVVETFQIRCL